MPLYEDGTDAIRANLERIREGHKVHIVPIGILGEEQLGVINAGRFVQSLKPIIAEVVFVGAHIYKSRIARDGYTIEDVIDQISSAMNEASEVLDAIYMTILQNPNGRADRYGNLVRDRAILECSNRHPRAELFSIVPKGDRIRPPK